MNVIIPILKMLMSSKMGSRIHNLGRDITLLQREHNIPSSCLDEGLGGTISYNHADTVARWIEEDQAAESNAAASDTQAPKEE